METIKWLFDYWVLEFFYGPYGNERYRDLMFNRWGNKYAEAYIQEVYNETK